MKTSFLKNLQWRYATKAFDPEKKISEEDLKKIMEAIRFSPSSFGLQPYHIHIISNAELRKELQAHAWHQPQVADASHFLVFSARTDLTSRIEQLMEHMSGGKPEVREQLKAYENMMIGFSDDREPSWVKSWAERQAYIALGFAVAACAEMGIDSCPMEGFDTAAFDKILKMPEHLKSAVSLAIGHRKEEPKQPKVRFSEEDLFTVL